VGVAYFYSLMKTSFFVLSCLKMMPQLRLRLEYFGYMDVCYPNW